MLSVLGWKKVEAKQCVSILYQTLGCPVVLDAPGFDEGIKCEQRILLGFGHPDLLQRPRTNYRFALRQLVEHVGGLVHPAALAARAWPYLFEGLPEAERAIGNRELGAHR